MADNKKNCLRVTMTNLNEAVTVTNNRAQYFADLAKQYRDEAKEHRDNAKFYAEQNSDVTLEYVQNICANLDRKIDTCVFKDKLPSISEFENDANYVNIDELNTSVSACVNNSLNKQQITNCITEKPKYLNWTSEDGVITLKAGSKLMYPDGFNSDGTRKFSYYTTTKDFIWSESGTNSSLRYLWLARTGQYGNNFAQDMLYVGDTVPTLTVNYCLWYDTANNVLKNTSNKGVNWSTNEGTFPFMMVYNIEGGVGFEYPTSVFDGIGIMDKCAWVADGIKALVPNGRNEDGTLNNHEAISKAGIGIASWTISIPEQASLILTSGGNISTGGTQYVESETEPSSNYTLWYNPITNEMKYKGASTSAWEKRLYMRIGSCAGTYGTPWADHFSYTEPNFKEAFMSVDFNDFKLETEAINSRINIINTGVGAAKAYIVETYKNGTSWYRVWSNGWKEQGGKASASATITFVKPFSTTPQAMITQTRDLAGPNNNPTVRTISTTKMTTYSETEFFWHAYGY